MRIDAMPRLSGEVGWESPANIALIKYWGKLPGQLPMNPSLSFSLSKSVVRVRVKYSLNGEGPAGLRSFQVNEQPKPDFKNRVEQYLKIMQAFYPFLSQMVLDIESQSNFPHSAGIASSAAAFSSLALALGSMSMELSNRHKPEESAFLRKASFAARLGSGSACRSVFGGFSLWGTSPRIPQTNPEFAVKLPEDFIHPVFQNLHDAILIVSDSKKEVSSSAGHALMDGHDFRQNRVVQAGKNLNDLLDALKNGNEESFVAIVENEALTLHGLMMSSRPGYILMKPRTLEIIEKIRNFRERNNIPVSFTLDAGPNIHLIYLDRDAARVKEFIQQKLLTHCLDGRWIDDKIGNGPREI